jgi:hypothetical protein
MIEEVAEVIIVIEGKCTRGVLFGGPLSSSSYPYNSSSRRKRTVLHEISKGNKESESRYRQDFVTSKLVRITRYVVQRRCFKTHDCFP